MEKEPGRVCLDTDVVIDYLKGTEETEDLIEKLHLRFDEVVLTAITVYELFVGVEYLDGKDREEIEAIVKSSSILPFDETASRVAAKISAELRKSGQQIGFPDELIAAICQVSNASLLTNSVEHFRRIRNLRVIGFDQLT